MNIKINIPYYRQTSFGGCGPACLLMVMKYWKKDVPFSESVEIDIWKKSILFPLRMTYSIGLAIAAREYGFGSVIIKERKEFVLPKIEDDIKYFESLGNFIDLEEIGEKSYKNDLLYISKFKNIHLLTEKITINKIIRILKKQFPIVMMINEKDTKESALPHWIVIDGIEANKFFLVKDPYNPNIRRIRNDYLREMINIGGTASDGQLLIVYPPTKDIAIREILAKELETW